VRIVAGLALLALLAVHTAEKVPLGLVPEMLWTCHVATALVAVGLLADQPRMVAIFGLFHLAVGLPAFLLDIVLHHDTTVSSVFLHTLTPAAGIVTMRKIGVPRDAPAWGAGLYVGSIGVARLLTPPELNVNLAFKAYDIWPAWFPVAGQWAVNTLGAIVSLVLVERALAWQLGRPE
jgi:hypothetical protein